MSEVLYLSQAVNPASWFVSEYWEMDWEGRFSHWDGDEWQAINNGLVGPVARWEDDGGAIVSREA